MLELIARCLFSATGRETSIAQRYVPNSFEEWCHIENAATSGACACNVNPAIRNYFRESVSAGGSWLKPNKSSQE